MSEQTNDQYLTVANQTVSTELKVKGSKFIAHIAHVVNKSQAESYYANIRRKYHDATHNCYAYRISRDEFRYSDDGEPSGSAGKPIYHIIEQNNLFQTIIVVTRYFGGTKLGTGGLSHAYSDAAKSALEETIIETKTRYVTLTIETNYDYLSPLLDLVNKHHGILGKTEYTDKIVICLQIPTSKFDNFKDEIDAFSERGVIIVDKEI
jgi:uncharacterized YigZ family protein